MSTGILFQITMGTGMALAIDKNNPRPGGQLLLEPADPADADQQWCWVFDPGTQASILFSPARDLFAAPANISRGAPVVLFPMNTPFTPATTWQVLKASGAAIRPPANIDLNLNAFGDSWPAGTKVGIWTWGGGTKNEVWTSTFLQSAAEAMRKTG